MDTFSILGGQAVTFQTAVLVVSGSIPGYGNYILFDFFVLLLLCFYFLSKTLLTWSFTISFAM